LDLSTFLIVLSGKNKKMDFIFLTNDLFSLKFQPNQLNKKIPIKSGIKTNKLFGKIAFLWKTK
jgi:hypothetical protein